MFNFMFREIFEILDRIYESYIGISSTLSEMLCIHEVSKILRDGLRGLESRLKNQ